MFSSSVAGNPFREMAFEPVTSRTHGSRYINPSHHRDNHGTSRASSQSGQDGEHRNGESPENGADETGNGQGSAPNPSPVWPQRALPGGRRLWRRLVIGFAFVATLGGVFVTLGGVYFKEAFAWSKEEGMTMPLVMCILAVVIGALFIIGSVILGKLIISDKWRKNQQPTYRNLAMPSARYRQPVPSEDPQVQIQMEPPSYEASANDSRTPPANIFIISGQEINVNMSAPPPYTEQDSIIPTETPPPEYTETTPQGDYQHPPEGTTLIENDSFGGSNVISQEAQNVFRVLSGRRELGLSASPPVMEDCDRDCDRSICSAAPDLPPYSHEAENSADDISTQL